MKAILISIKPEWVAKILNGEKTIEVRKTAPKCELPVDVYIYCSEPHAKEVLSLFVADVRPYVDGRAAEFIERERVDKPNMRWSICNGKVVAKFTLDGVDKFTEGLSCFEYERLTRGETDKSVRPYYKKALKRACLTDEELQRYAPDRTFYAWHISDLVIFDKPKELDEFALKRVPQSWCYLEEKE